MLRFTINEYVKVLKRKTEIFIFIFARHSRSLSQLKLWRAIFAVHWKKAMIRRINSVLSSAVLTSK